MSALSSIRNGLTSSGSSIIVGIIIFGLVATFGGFLGEGSVLSNNSILSINDKSISQGEFAIEYGRIESEVSESGQEFSTEIIENITKENIIYKELLAQSAKKVGLNIDDKKLNTLIRNDQSFYNDNSFDIDLFRGFLSRLGMTPESFKEYIKSRYLASDLQVILDKDINFSNEYIRNFIVANNQTRDISFSKIILADEASKEDVGKEEVERYYNDNKFLYISPLKISYKLLSLDQDLFNESVDITEEEIEFEKKAILENLKTQKRISHIEIAFNEDNREEKFMLAEKIRAELNDQSLNFNDAVLEFSSDLSTKNNSGDLGFTDGTIFPDEFENEIKSLKLNQISSIIDLTTSFHIIKLIEETNSELSNEDIIERITFTKSSEKLDDVLNYIDENIFITDIESLSSEFNLIAQNISEEEEKNFLTKYKDLDLDDLEEGNLYGPLESDNGYLVIGVNKIIDQSYKTLDEVKIEITNELRNIKASGKTYSLIENKKKELANDSQNFTKYSEIKRNNLLLPSQVTQKLFSFDTSENEIFSITLNNGDAYIVKLDKINENKGVISSEDLDQGREYLTSVYQDIIRQSFINELRDNSKIN
ncbi:MAG: peptidyl-prolyl cis-trans isomerase [Gammaproteobacteria bacterium]|nr:MAG: peptidyl-prolyl cis-trans isomerase [Gammaproteobacteria bacterium]